MATETGEFGTNGVTLSGAPEKGMGLFGGVGLSINGNINDCKNNKPKDKCKNKLCLICLC
ncbi:hypothetical protein [Pseudoalteromonas rubra]|uniref:hypothetical protein n=1 Tax=Pseudoalteromonas rubra TaxID=43658 RepID=UPI000F76E9FD|nr:hypothetical protein [Pseudoalteromonas rubra]